MVCGLGFDRIKDKLMRHSASKAEDIHARLQTLERELSSLTGSLEVCLVSPLPFFFPFTHSLVTLFHPPPSPTDPKIPRLHSSLGHPPLPHLRSRRPRRRGGGMRQSQRRGERLHGAESGGSDVGGRVGEEQFGEKDRVH